MANIVGQCCAEKEARQLNLTPRSTSLPPVKLWLTVCLSPPSGGQQLAVVSIHGSAEEASWVILECPVFKGNGEKPDLGTLNHGPPPPVLRECDLSGRQKQNGCHHH